MNVGHQSQKESSAMVTIAILGMHRSGTSCLAGSLQQAGLYLGEVVEQAPHNRKGNRESLAIRSLNDRLLESNDGAWNRPPAELVWSEIFASTRDRLIAKFADRTSWGFKDPRTLLTLPFWQDGIPELVFVGTFRHPRCGGEIAVGAGRNRSERCLQFVDSIQCTFIVSCGSTWLSSHIL